MDKFVIQQRRRSYLRFLCIYGIVKYVFYENRLLFNIDILSFDWVFFLHFVGCNVCNKIT